MKILYVKTNSERAKKFQLRTIIYEENGQRYVKKQAIHKESIEHLKKMKDTYMELSKSVANSNIKLAKIIDESNDSLMFEFIDGVSLEKKFNEAKKLNKKTEEAIVSEYMTLLKSSFKTIPFDSKTMVTQEFKETFGDFDYSEFDGELCFDGISNIDLIFSNIIYKNHDIYLIDYEWVYDMYIPIEFAAFRALHADDLHWDIYWGMEKHFVFQVVADESSFLNLQDKFGKRRLSGISSLQAKDEQIADLNVIINDKYSIIHDKNRHIESQNEEIENFKKLSESLNSIIKDKDRHIASEEKSHKSIVFDKDVHIDNLKSLLNEKNMHINNQSEHIKQLSGDIEHWHNIAKTMTIKGRIKSLIKKLLPASLIQAVKSPVDTVETMITQEESLDNPEILPSSEYIYLEPKINDNIKAEIASFAQKPLISIIMPVYNVDPKWLKLAMGSIETQWYKNWEICLADDKSTNQETIDYLKTIDDSRIKVKFLEENGNISAASNTALTLASGEYIALMDNDDELTPDALYEIVKIINNYDADFIYSDEDKIEMDRRHSDPHFKPDFAPDMFLAHNYLSHLGVIKKELIDKVGGFEIGLEGSQDYDLYLKVLEHTDKIYHIDKVLYHWRKIPGSTAAEYGEKSYAQEAGRKALENAMQRRGVEASVKNGQTPGTYKIDYTLINKPLVSIIIPFKDKSELIKVCIESLLEKTTYENFEIIAISNNSNEEETFKEMKYLEGLDTRVSFYEYNVPFNYSQINNYAVKTYARGEQILFLNNDIEIITPSWIEEMLMYSQQSQNGAIGAKLYFPNDTVQHAGLVMAPKTIHSVILVYQGFSREDAGYGARLKCVNNYSALTAACLMLKRSIFDEMDGFDEERLSVAYNDVDFCLRIQEAGYHNVWTPYAELYHHESISRGYEVSRKAVERREKEKWNLKDKHPDIFIKGDPFYNKNLSRFSIGSELFDWVKNTHESVNGIDFYEEIIWQKNLREKKQNKICIFSHYDSDNTIKGYVAYYLQELSKISDIIFVSTAEGLSETSIENIEVYCKDIIVKKNIGYDFSAWKTGMDYLGSNLNTYEHLILCNDSVFGPFFDLEEIFEKMKGTDLWAMTDNHEIEYHLQSYFMVYNKTAFTHPIFRDFWKNLKIYSNKQILIENNEIEYSRRLINSELTYDTYYRCKDRNYVNVLQYYWKELIADYQFPFIKKEILTTNPLQLDVSNWEELIRDTGKYDTRLITDSLQEGM